jgi:hypothetical protein
MDICIGGLQSVLIVIGIKMFSHWANPIKLFILGQNYKLILKHEIMLSFRKNLVRILQHPNVFVDLLFIVLEL